MDIPEQNVLLRALEQGRDAAQATRVGQQFVGAFGEAERAGYSRDSVEGKVFMVSYIAALPDVFVDGLGFVTRIRNRKGA